MLLALSFITATVGGLVLNGWVFWRIHSSISPKWHVILAAVFFGLLVHQILLLCIVRTIIAVFEVPPNQEETMGYFVGPNLLAFVSVPLALVLLGFLSRTRAEQPTAHAR